MRADELISKAELITDSDGNARAVQIDPRIWRELLDFLEEIEDSAEAERSHIHSERTVSWEEIKTRLLVKEGMHSIELTLTAAKDMDELPLPYSRLIGNLIDSLSKDPRPERAQSQQEENQYSLRIGDYRIIYDISDTAREVTVHRIRSLWTPYTRLVTDSDDQISITERER